jgi:hypothetical protein
LRDTWFVEDRSYVAVGGVIVGRSVVVLDVEQTSTFVTTHEFLVAIVAQPWPPAIREFRR